MNKDRGTVIIPRPQSIENICSSLVHTIVEDDVHIEIQCKFLATGISDRRKERRFQHPQPPFSRLFLFSRGRARIDTGGADHILEPGLLHLLPAAMPFDVAYEPSFLYWFHLHVSDRSGVPVFAELNEAQAVDSPELFQRIRKSVDEGDVGTMHLYVFEAVRAFLRLVQERLVQRAKRSGRFEPVISHIQENPVATLNIDDLAEIAGISRSALSKGFRRSMGVSLKDYITSIQLQKAQELLIYTDHTVLQIADELGYTHASYFHRVFRRLTGRTPTAYRQSLRG